MLRFLSLKTDNEVKHGHDNQSAFIGRISSSSQNVVRASFRLELLKETEYASLRFVQPKT